MLYCATELFYAEIYRLLKLLSDKKPISLKQQERVKELLDLWDQIECPDSDCVQEKCPYASSSIDWVKKCGYENLHELIEHLDRSGNIIFIPIKPYCETISFYDEMHDLLYLISYKKQLSLKQNKKLKELLDLWDQIECPDSDCVQEKCPYASSSIDWVKKHGYENLHELIEHLDRSGNITFIPVKPYCKKIDFFVEIYGLLELIRDKKKLSQSQNQDLKELVGSWKKTHCPKSGCIPGKCPYGYPYEWVEKLGYKNLHQLIKHLDQTKDIDFIPRKRSIDPLKAKWARRKGHFNP